jgi:hypothetical protein
LGALVVDTVGDTDVSPVGVGFPPFKLALLLFVFGLMMGLVPPLVELSTGLLLAELSIGYLAELSIGLLTPKTPSPKRRAKTKATSARMASSSHHQGEQHEDFIAGSVSGPSFLFGRLV